MTDDMNKTCIEQMNTCSEKLDFCVETLHNCSNLVHLCYLTNNNDICARSDTCRFQAIACTDTINSCVLSSETCMYPLFYCSENDIATTVDRPTQSKCDLNLIETCFMLAEPCNTTSHSNINVITCRDKMAKCENSLSDCQQDMARLVNIDEYIYDCKNGTASAENKTLSRIITDTSLVMIEYEFCIMRKSLSSYQLKELLRFHATEFNIVTLTSYATSLSII